LRETFRTAHPSVSNDYPPQLATNLQRLDSKTVFVAVIGVSVVFPIWFFRYARALWMCLDLYLNPPVNEDFESRGR
jgi:hypothetical protein